MASTSKTHRAYPQPCCHSWPLISSSVMGTEAALAVLSIYQAASHGGHDPLYSGTAPHRLHLLTQHKRLFLAALCEKPAGHFCCPGKALAVPGHSGWVSTGSPGDVPPVQHCAGMGKSSVASSPTASSSHIHKGSARSLLVPMGPQLLFLLGRDLQESAVELYTGE